MRRVKIILVMAGVAFAVLLLPFAISCSGKDGMDGISGSDGRDGEDGSDGHDCVIAEDPDDSAYLVITCGTGDDATAERLARAMCGAMAYDPRKGFVCRRGQVTFTDERDGQHYKIAKIGTQIWMAENLNWAGSNGGLGRCYDLRPANCDVYGRLYTWSEVLGLSSSCDNAGSNCALLHQSSQYRGICPEGWHVPERHQWDMLDDFVGGGTGGGTKLKARSGWSDDGNGTDDHGFSALPGGHYRAYNNAYGDLGLDGYWWDAISTMDKGDPAAFNANIWRLGLSSSSNTIGRYDVSRRDDRYSLRCVMNYW